MKLGRPEVNPTSTGGLGRAGSIALLLIVFAAGLLLGDLGWSNLLLDEIRGLVAQVATAANDDRLPTLALDITFENYNVLLSQRESALNNGVYLASSDGFVPAEMRFDGDPIAVELQLREGAAENLGVDDKWPFEVRLAPSASPPQALPFERFSLEDPAENNWLMQWAFTEALQQEGLLAARYRFVRLTLNGEDRGIYAVQEAFEPGLLEAQGRPPGVIVGFDKDPFLRTLAHFGGDYDAALEDPISALSAWDLRSFTIDTSEDERIDGSLDLQAQHDEAVALLYALQTGQRRPSQVLDPATYGRFLAIVDLWGASEATSLLNLGFYYDAGSGTLQPISVDANALGSDERLAVASTYEDPVLQMAYVREASRISQPDYLDALKAKLGPTWERLSGAVKGELRDPEPPWDELEARQAVLRRSLNPVQPVLAYLLPGAMSDYGALDVDIANTLNLPVEVIGFDVAGATFVDVADAEVISSTTEVLPDLGEGVVLRPADDASEALHYTRFRLSLGAIHQVDEEATFDPGTEISVAVRLLGAPDAQMVPATAGLPEPLPSGATP